MKEFFARFNCKKYYREINIAFNVFLLLFIYFNPDKLGKWIGIFLLYIKAYGN